jgi:hypothetical protein
MLGRVGHGQHHYGEVVVVSWVPIRVASASRRAMTSGRSPPCSRIGPKGRRRRVGSLVPHVGVEDEPVPGGADRMLMKKPFP